MLHTGQAEQTSFRLSFRSITVFIDPLELGILVRFSLILVLLKHRDQKLFDLCVTIPIKQIISITEFHHY